MYRPHHRIPTVAALPIAFAACGSPQPTPPDPVQTPGQQTGALQPGGAQAGLESNCMSVAGFARLTCHIEAFCSAYSECMPGMDNPGHGMGYYGGYGVQTPQQCVATYVSTYAQMQAYMSANCIEAYANLFACLTREYESNCGYGGVYVCLNEYAQIDALCY